VTVLDHPDWQRLDIAAKYRLRWRLTARPNQLTPDDHVLCTQPREACEAALKAAQSIPPMEQVEFLRANGHYDWQVWVLLMGRGGGKSRSGAEDTAEYAIEHPGHRIGLVGESFADVRDTMVEGDSGLLSVLPQKMILNWNRSIGELLLTNGSRMDTFSAEKPNQLRGPNLHRLWADELAAWQYLEDTWDMGRFALRKSRNPKIVVTTTPRPLPFIRELVAKAEKPEGGVIVSTGSTFENAANLSPVVLHEYKEVYEGTRIGRQELYGEILEDMEGALWNLGMIEADRLPLWAMPDPDDTLGRTVVAVDPAITDNPDSDETGIVVVGMTRGNCPYCHRAEAPHAIVLDDVSGIYSPNEWALRVDRAFTEWKADRVIAEKNQGGDMVRSTLIAAAPHLPVSDVWATKSKQLRAEPVFALYERHKVHHWAGADLSKLEKQQTSWDPTLKTAKSPDRLDALVYALTELMLPKLGAGPGYVRDTRHAGRR
jgi:phage terminase large subunit-like protein